VKKLFRKKKVKKQLHFGGPKHSKNFACGGRNAWRSTCVSPHKSNMTKKEEREGDLE
jgi:hypothetical protein